jgi:hypothetical protein
VRRHATTIVLSLLVVGLCVFLWFDRGRVSDGERRAREDDVFPAWRRDDASRVEVAHEGETLVLVRDADKTWRMTSPRAERVDQAAADRLLGTLELASVVRRVSPGESSVLGLDAPRATGKITMGALVFRFALGGASPRPEGTSYLRVDDGAPVVVSKALTDALLASSDTYRDRTVVPYLSTELARLEVRRGRGEAGFAVERKDDRSFLVQGEAVRASRNALDKVWAALAEVRAEAFLKDADAEELTREPRLTIRMTPKEGPAGEIVVGGECPGHPSDVVVLRRAPSRVLACAPKGAMEALEAIEPAALVDRHPFALRHDEIEELRLESIGPDAHVLELARRGTGFHERQPIDRELAEDEADAVSELLARIEESTAKAVSASVGAFTPVARARARSGEHEEIVEIGPADGGSVALRRLHDGARLVVSRAVARRLVPRATSTRGRTLLGDPRRVTRVVLRCGTAQQLADQGSGLRLVEPTGYETDGSITQLVDALTRGRALLWVADADDGTFGLGPETCRAVLGFADGDAPVTVRLGAEGEGGVYGLVDGHPEVFVAPLALEELARRIYVSHASLRVAPERVESVRVVAQGRPVVGLDPSRLRDAAGALYADRVVGVGPPDVGRPDVELTIAMTEGGPPRRVLCSAPVVSPTGTARRCATPDVKAVFEVRAGAIDAFLRGGAEDAGADAPH